MFGFLFNMTLKLSGRLRAAHVLARALWVAALVAACVNPALADQEASNVTHVVAGPYGRCYAKSIPEHIYDPEGSPRQQGRTEIYRVGNTQDVMVEVYDWFSQQLFVLCGPGGDIAVARIGPWQRGHNPRANDLALAFYKSGQMLKNYTTLDIAGGERVQNGGLSIYKNVSASVSHYSVFSSWPELVKITSAEGPVFSENWVVRAQTVDGRVLTFDIASGELQ
jgi:hypothetical protein